MLPPKPLILDPRTSDVALCNWPHNQIEEDELLVSVGGPDAEEPAAAPQKELEINLDSRNFGAIDEPQPEVTGTANFAANVDIDEPVDAAWGNDDIIDIPDMEVPSAGTKTKGAFQDIADSAPGKDPIVERAKNSQLAGELVSIGEFEAAAGLLRKQIGVVNVQPLQPIFNKIHKSSRVKLPGLPFTNPIDIQLSEDGKRPYVLGSIGQLGGLLKVAYRFTTEGKFADALQSFQNVLLHVPLLVLRKAQEEEDVYALIRICYHYILAMKCELNKKSNAVRTFLYTS